MEFKDIEVACPFCSKPMDRYILMDQHAVVYGCSCPEYLTQQQIIVESILYDGADVIQ
jgi:hypothetical protein